MPQQTLNFISFHHDIVTFKASHDISELRFPALEPHNLQIIASLCRRLDDALKGELYTADELPVLIVANQLRKRADVIPTISELETMKKGAAIVVRHSVRKGLIADLDNTDSSSVFATAERMAKALLQSEKIEEVKKAWQARSALAMYPMQALHEMTVSLNQLENYISLLRKDFDFSNANQLAIYYKKYVTNMTDAKLAELDSFVNALQTKISTLRDMIAQSMLERLRLLPTSVLENPDSLPNGVRDDLIHTSLKELVATKVVSKNYLSNYELQTSSATCLTSDDVRRACNYIHELQDATLQAELSKLYITRTHAIATDNAYSADDHNDNVILIPTAIPGHYHANVQPNFNQGKWDFIFITTDSNSPKTVKMSGLKRGDLDDSSPGMSFFDMKDNSRVVISTVEAYLEVPLENNSLPQLCELILEKDYPADTHDDGFYYLVDDREDQALLAFAAKHFKSNKNASFFIDHIKQHLPLNNGMSLERFCDEQLKFMYQELQKDCLANLDASLFSGFGLTHGQCSQIFTALERKYFAGEFADTKVDEIVNVVEQIINEVAAPGHKSRLPMFVVEDADCRAYYQTNILINLQKKNYDLKNLDLVIARAELEVCIFYPKAISEETVLAIEEQVFKDRYWWARPELWLEIKNKCVALAEAKEAWATDLTMQVMRLKASRNKFYMSTTLTDGKVDVLTRASLAIQAAKTMEELDFAVAVLQSNRMLGLTRNYFAVFSSTPNDSTTTLQELRRPPGAVIK